MINNQRLNTIHNADLICVILYGSMVEQGTHETLLALEGSVILDQSQLKEFPPFLNLSLYRQRGDH